MTSPTREEVFGALFTRFQTLGSLFTAYSRRMMDYSAIAPGLLPILILWEWPEETRYEARVGQGLPVNVWEAAAVIVFQNDSKPTDGDPTTGVPGSTILNPLVDAVRGLFAADDPGNNQFTLGGLVYQCRVEGRTIIEPGDTDASGRGGALIPIRVLVPAQGGY